MITSKLTEYSHREPHENAYMYTDENGNTMTTIAQVDHMGLISVTEEFMDQLLVSKGWVRCA